MQDSSDAISDASSEHAEPSPTAEREGLQEGMLPRDRPKRTTFYDSVAERQMTQTDAKLFYQRSKIDLRSGSGGWSHSTPQGSHSGSQPPTEYGGDSLILEHEGGQPSHPFRSAHCCFKATRWPRRLTWSAENLEPVDSSSKLRGQTINSGSQSFTSNSRGSQGFQDTKLAHVSNVGLTGSSIFDTEPQITAELSAISKNIQEIRDLRRKYIMLSSQGPDDNPRDGPSWDIYPPPPEPAWKQTRDAQESNRNAHGEGLSSQDKASPKRPTRKRKPGQDIGEDFDMDDLLPLPGEDDDVSFKLDDSGVYQIFQNGAQKPAIRVPTIREFYMDLDKVITVSSDGPSKSFAFRRLQYLEGKFNLYVLLNEYQETADSKKVPHRDFYNVRKVDTHVHHSACMNQKHLLRFIKSKMKKYPNEVVLFRDGKHLTLAEVFASIKLTAYDLSIDTLDMHVSSDSPP